MSRRSIEEFHKKHQEEMLMSPEEKLKAEAERRHKSLVRKVYNELYNMRKEMKREGYKLWNKLPWL